MTFMIRFIKENKGQPGLLEPDTRNTRIGEILIEEYLERFEASTSFWNVEDYQRHWNQAIERIVSGEGKSCLITSMYNPEFANFIFWWPLYRVGRKVFIQNQVLLLEDENTPFNPRNPFASVKDRQTFTEDGLPISEWEVPLPDLELFLAS